MSNSQQTNVTGAEEVPLTIIAGAGDEQKDNPLTQVSSRVGRVATSCYRNKHQRTLAYCSIICGCSCIGVKALTNSVKAELTEDPEVAAKFSRKARRFGIISILTWVGILVSVPILTVLISYLITLKE